MEDLDGGLVSGLLVLAAIAESGSFGRAASRLGKTQPAVSRAIQRLEDRLRAKLVQRTSRHVEVTDAGHELLSKVLPLPRELKRQPPTPLTRPRSSTERSVWRAMPFSPAWCWRRSWPSS